MAHSDKLQYTAHFLKNTLKVSGVYENEPMKNHTSFKAGGNAALLVEPKNLKQAKDIIARLSKNEVPFFVMGNGTNLLIRDGGYKGVIVKLRENISNVSVDGNVITAESGALISAVSKFALECSLSGLEFAEGIPGTIGGALAMNAGAYGGEMKDVVTSVTVFDNEGNTFVLSNNQMEFAYRSSALQKHGFVCGTVKLALKHDKKDSIKSMMDVNKTSRINKQPLDKPSAGSTFKRPDGDFAGRLIMESGLKGYSIGGAAVSNKHCGFVVNNGGATATDIIKLIEYIKHTVKEKHGVLLETEVKIIGEE